MIRYLGRRILVTLPTLWLVTVVVFSMVRLLPGDPAETIAGLHATPESVAGLRQELGLDRPLLVQYGHFLGGLLAPRPRPVDHVAGSGSRRAPPAPARVAHPGRPQHGRRGDRRRAPRRARRAPAPELGRLPRHVDERGGPVHADVRARADPDPRPLGAVAAPARDGRGDLVALHPAGDHPRAAGGGGRGPDGPQQPPRGAAAGLRAHRVGQGSLAARVVYRHAL